MTPRAYSSTRRDLASRQTREAILDAALELLAEQGYAETTVAQIAERAGVAANTIYTRVGGKSDLVVAAMDRSFSEPVVVDRNEMTAVDTLTDGAEVLRRHAHAQVRVLAARDLIYSVVEDAARHDAGIAEAYADLVMRHRKRIQEISIHLIDIGAVKPELEADEVVDSLWFFFGIPAWQELRRMGWSAQKIAVWLSQRVGDAVLR